MKVSRNALCPCGSGRKYKRCCLADTAVTEPTRPRPAPMVRDPLLDRLGDFMQEFAPDHLARCVQRLLGTRTVPSLVEQVFIPMALFAMAGPTGETIAQAFANRRGASLSPPLRRQLEARSAASFSIFEVLRVEPEHGLDLVDRLTGERMFVYEVSATRGVSTRAGLLARVADFDNGKRIDGLYPIPLAPESADRVVASITERLGPGPIDRARLRDPEIAEALFHNWADEAARAKADSQREVPILNTDGDRIESTVDRFELLMDTKEAIAVLLTIEGVKHHDVEGDRSVIHVVRKGNAMHPSWVWTGLAQISVRGPKLTVATNSRRRADVLRARLEAALGERLRHCERQVAAAETARGSGPMALDSQPMSGWIATSPIMQVVLHRRVWRHQPLELLGGLTPLAAVEFAGPRLILHRLLCTNEYMSPGPHEQAAVQQFRREIGLGELGEPLPAHQRVSDASCKASARLLEFAMPLLLLAADADEGEAIVRVANIVWNGALDLDHESMVELARTMLEHEELDIDHEVVEEWVEFLSPRRKLYDDPRVFAVGDITYERGDFSVQVGSLVVPNATLAR